MTHPAVLLFGFEPFDGAASNPSWLLAKAFDGQMVAGARVQALQLPCVFGVALTVLEQAVRSRRPCLVLALGLAAGRGQMSVERIAINVDDARIADNAGNSPLDCPVVSGGPAAYFSTLPIKAMVHQMQAAGVPAEVSQSAGTFVCNHAFYGLMHLLRRRKAVRAGFMHVPLLLDAHTAVGMPGLDWDTQQLGVHTALHTALTTSDDWALAGGTIS